MFKTKYLDMLSKVAQSSGAETILVQMDEVSLSVHVMLGPMGTLHLLLAPMIRDDHQAE